MNDNASEVQDQTPPVADPTPEAPAADAAPEETAEPQPQAGGVDVSTAPPTAPAPLPGVPAQPVNAVRHESETPAATMDPARIGEATSPPQGP